MKSFLTLLFLLPFFFFQPHNPQAEFESGTVSEIRSMTGNRAAHTSTTLVDGRVLIVGGLLRTGNGSDPVEFFDPHTNRFTPGPALGTPRHSHSATVLQDGRVLISGGYDERGNYLGSVEIFDPENNRFVPSAPMNTARADHESILLTDGRVLTMGGVGHGWTFLASAEIYDPVTGKFTPTASMSVARESHATVRLLDGRILVVGGHMGRRSNIVLYRDAEIFDPKTERFVKTGSMTTPRHKHDATLLADGRVLVSGGADERDADGVFNTTEVFDPKTNQFSRAAPLQLGRYKHQGSSVLLGNGSVLFAGGATRAEAYSLQTGVSKVIPGARNMNGQFSASSLLKDGRVLITGGYRVGSGPTNKAWVYTP